MHKSISECSLYEYLKNSCNHIMYLRKNLKKKKIPEEIPGDIHSEIPKGTIWRISKGTNGGIFEKIVEGGCK